MAGTLLDRKLIQTPASRLRFEVATPKHDAAIRRLLRENPLRGEISISLEREPAYFAHFPGDDEQTILAFESEKLVCMGRCVTRDLYLEESPRRAGYLGELRLDHHFQGRFDIIRRGYRFFEELARIQPADFYFTSISAGNKRSLRLLERGMPGMPYYEFLDEIITLLIPVPRSSTRAGRIAQMACDRLSAQRLRWGRGSREQVPELVSFLNENSRSYPLALHWSEHRLLALEQFGLPLKDIHIVRDGPSIVACAAAWDQRDFRQTVIRAYSRRLALLRSYINLAAAVRGRPGLPETNSILAHAFVAPLAIADHRQELLPELVKICAGSAALRQIEYLSMGCSARDPRLETIRSCFPCREYSSRLYQVQWRSIPSEVELKEGPLLPEIAFL